MDIYSKARELARMIGESSELSNLKRLESEVYHNEDSTNLTKEYSEIYNKLVNAVSNKNDTEISLLKESLNDTMEKINNDKLTKDMFEAKDEFDKMIETINSIINFAITGEDGSGCSSGCGSCGSCK